MYMKVLVEVNISEMNKEPNVINVYSELDRDEAIANAKINGNWLFERKIFVSPRKVKNDKNDEACRAEYLAIVKGADLDPNFWNGVGTEALRKIVLILKEDGLRFV